MITIVDSGIGMHDEELERANALISSASALTLAPSRFLGHYVVAQLAARHGLAVHLAASPAGGLTATIAVPAVLLGAAERAQVDVRRAATPRRSTRSTGERTAPVVGLPRREPTAEHPPARPRARRPAATAVAFRAAAPPPPLPPELTPAVAAGAPARRADRTSRARRADEIDDFDEIDVTVPEALLVDFEPEVAPEPEPEAGPLRRLRRRTEAARARARRSGSAASPTCGARRRRARRPPCPRRRPPRPRPAPATGAAAEPGPTAPRVAPDRRAVVRGSRAGRRRRRRPVRRQEPASPFSEDLLPQRLPKRGRRSSRLETPWVRERPASRRRRRRSPPAARRTGRARRAAAVAAAAAGDARASHDRGRPRIRGERRGRSRSRARAARRPTRRPRRPTVVKGSRSSPPSAPRPNRPGKKPVSMIGEGIDGADQTERAPRARAPTFATSTGCCRASSTTTPGVTDAVAVSSDGLLMAMSSSLERAGAEQLAAIIAGMTSLAESTARCFALGEVDQVIIAMQEGYLFVSSVSDGSSLGVVADRRCDVGAVGYQMTLLVERVGAALESRRSSRS